MSRTDPVEGATARGRHERSVEHPEGGRGGHDPRAGVDRAGVRPRVGLRLIPLLEQEGVGSCRSRFGRRSQPGRAAADHQDLDVEVHHLARVVILGARNRAEAGLRSDERLDHGPRPTGAMEHLVVEARWHHERQRVEPTVDIPARGRPGVLTLDTHAVSHRLGARTDVRDPVDLHQAVRTRRRHAEQAPRTVVLERAGGDRDTRGGERRPDGVPLERADLPTLEGDRDGTVPTDALSRGLGEPSRHAGASSRSDGQYVRRISFVDVCRSARNHLRHP